MCLSILEGGAPNVQRQFIYVAIKGEERCAEEWNALNGRQQAAGSGIWGQGLLCGHWWNGKCFLHVKSSFQSEMSPRKVFVIPGVCHCSRCRLSWKCKSLRAVVATSVSPILSPQKPRQNTLWGYNFPFMLPFIFSPLTHSVFEV